MRSAAARKCKIYCSPNYSIPLRSRSSRSWFWAIWMVYTPAHSVSLYRSCRWRNRCGGLWSLTSIAWNIRSLLAWISEIGRTWSDKIQRLPCDPSSPMPTALFLGEVPLRTSKMLPHSTCAATEVANSKDPKDPIILGVKAALSTSLQHFRCNSLRCYIKVFDLQINCACVCVSCLLTGCDTATLLPQSQCLQYFVDNPAVKEVINSPTQAAVPK